MDQNEFNDLILLDDNSIKRIAREVPSKDLALALNLSTEELQKKFFKNMSERIVPLLQELMQVLGTKDLDECISSQERILSVWRDLKK